MATSKGMTQKAMFEHIMDVMSDDMEVVEFCERKIAQLSKPRARKTSAAVVEFREKLKAFMAEVDGGPMSCGEMAALMTDQLGEVVSAQKVSAAFRYFVKSGEMVEVETEKKSAPKLYAIA